MSRRFFDEARFEQGVPCELGEAASHHIARVLRMRPGETLTVFNGTGGEWQARLESVGRHSVVVVPETFHGMDRTPALPCTVALPVIKGDRMDYAIQKGTELGATAFRLVHCARSDVRLDGERLQRKLAHWRQVAISACEQCGLNRVPDVAPVAPLADIVSGATASLRLIAHPGDSPLAPDALATAGDVLLLTGPEGGFSDDEIALARAHGFHCFAFGERVLRAETAPPVLLAVLQQMHRQPFP